jgi:hypothetical protein
MSEYAIDHVFACCAPGAPEAQRLLDLGLAEGTPNIHPGQGTACRRFFFDNAYLELLWVTDEDEAQGPIAAPTRLWTRWSQRATGGASPFGLILRSADESAREPPFPSWAYRPPYLPSLLAIDVAEDTPLEEPALFYLPFARPPAVVAAQPRQGAMRLATVDVEGPYPAPISPAAQRLVDAGLVTFSPAPAHVLTLGVDGGRQPPADLRPDLPLVLRWRV